TPTPELMEKIQREEPQRLRACNPAVSRDLEAIVHKCLEKDPKRRYARARELADDLRRFLEGKVVRARPVRGLERTWKWVRRRPVLAGLAAGLLVALVAGIVTSTLLAVWARASEKEARKEWERAEGNAELAQTNAGQARKQRDLALKTVRRVVNAID